jgi:hypothetical protein
MSIRAPIAPGCIFRHDRFYLSRETGEFETKYLVSLATTPGGDLVMKLLTSRPHGRPESPPCYHGHPYPGFYLGLLGAPLTVRSWLDLRGLPDFDSVEFSSKCRRGQIVEVARLPPCCCHRCSNALPTPTIRRDCRSAASEPRWNTCVERERAG